MALRHQFTITCEDLRREDNGKLLILGMFTGNIGTPQIPFAMPSLTFIQFFEADAIANHQVRMRLTHLESGQQLAEAHAMVNVVQPGPVMLPLKLPNIVFNDRGTYSMATEVDGQREPMISSFTVVIAPPQAQTQQVRPLGR